MQTLQMIVELINTCGFPIACVIALSWYAKDTTAKVIALTQEVTSALVSSTKTMEELKDAINNISRKE